ncbi:MAG TPA: NAD(P)H-quinone oxidoreductase [Puia sp.]|jgi:putative PIG3 family NAD(P)H quinone oxidoreductase|nr:NAD(P)H-quinone oxidoreductase [Puia sp.]
MKAIWMTAKGGPEVLEFREVEKPVPAAGEVLIRVAAAGLNRADIYTRTSPSYGGDVRIPGLEVSGVIESIGPESAAPEATGPTPIRWKPGDAVCALVNGGGYAEYVTVPAGQCLPIPAGWSLEEAAGLPEAVLTVWLNAVRTARLQSGDHFLVHGGTSGIGIVAIQLGTAMGAEVYTTAGTDEKCRWCEKLGAKKAVNYKTADFEVELAGIGIDVILDMTGGDFTVKNLCLLREEGRIVYINAMRGRDSMIDIREIMTKRLTLTGSMLRPRDTAFKSALTAEVETGAWPLISRGGVKPVIYRVLPLARAADAQRIMENGEHIGKILLRT